MKPAFIVEGAHEKAIVEKLCEVHIVKALRTNGKNFPSDRMASLINDFLKELVDRNYPIMILFDREGRKISAEKLIDEVMKNLMELGWDLSQLIIGVPDNKIENWIIPFVDANGNITSDPINGNFEGKNCIGELERRCANGKRPYNKVVTGPKLFCQIDPPKLAEVSRSFKLFYDQAKKHCLWLNDKKSLGQCEIL